MASDLVSEPEGTSSTCPHIVELDKRMIVAKLKAISAWNVSCQQASSRPVKRRKISAPICGIESCRLTLSRPFVCLRCSFSGCWRDHHMRQHLEEQSHPFCQCRIDAKTGTIFCLECDDFVYDSAISQSFSSVTIAAEEKATAFQVAKNNRERFKLWTPNEKDVSLLNGAVNLPCQGRRGLLNLGQTCFLNAILQSFVANPLLRDFFLSDKHNHQLCKIKDCTCCEMDKLFAEIYAENPGPYGPASFLATTWRATSDLAGYAQQDAHEFFISALNQIHATSRGHTKFQCICIVHSTFDGLLQSDVKCERCGNITTATDSMFDISLELQDKNGEYAAQELTLASCLRKYTQPEKLGPNSYSCAKCGKVSHEASKRMSIQKLPPVLSFQFKRFEHKSAAQKVEVPVRFPSTINMAPFTTLYVDTGDHEARGSSGISNPAMISLPVPGAMFDYDLFSVVCHEGQINNGHYTCFARSQDEWYRYDDDKVTHSTLGECLSMQTQAYMCFYVKRHLDYKPYVTPSYKVTREAEAVKEKERELEKAARMREVEDALLATV